MNQSVTQNNSISANDALRLLDQMIIPAAGEATPLPDQGPEESQLENDLTQLILSVLKIEPEDFSPQRALMDYGLDSIAATEIGTRFTDQFGITVPPTVFFEFPDLRSFVGYLNNNHGDELQHYYGEQHSAPANNRINTPMNADGSVPAPPVQPSAERSVNGSAAQITPPDTLSSDAPMPVEAMWQKHTATELAVEPVVSRTTQSTGQATRRATDPSPANGEPDKPLLDGLLHLVDQAEIVSIPRPGSDARIECAVYGDGQPLLMFGGLVMHYSVMWRLQLQTLGQRYKLIMFHMPGCGGADFYDDLSLRSLTADARHVLDHLGIHQPLPVIGYSFGGVLAQAFSLEHSDRCSALCVSASSPSAEGATDFQVLMRELQKSAGFMTLNRGWKIPSLSAYQRVVAGFDVRQQLSHLTVPALVISGGQDAYQPPKYSQGIADAVAGSQLHCIEDAGHLLAFTHYQQFNQLLLQFLDQLPARPSERPGTKATTAAAATPTAAASVSVLPFQQPDTQTLATLRDYVHQGVQGHCAMLSEPAAETTVLLNALCNLGKPQQCDYRSYFMTSVEEALDAALRLSRHHARNRSQNSPGTLVIIDPSGYWQGYFDPLDLGTQNALVPGVEVVATLHEARQLLQQHPDARAAALVISSEAGLSAAEIDQQITDCRGSGTLTVILETGPDGQAPEHGLLPRLTQHPDLVVVGECMAGHQVPVAACMVNAEVNNPWMMTPNESYVRHVMTSFGFPLAASRDYLLPRLKDRMTEQQRADFRCIREDTEANLAIHQRLGNAGYARVARMHGFDGRFHSAHGVRSQWQPDQQPNRDIIDCFVNVGTCPRGLNPRDVVTDVANRHDPSVDYWQQLASDLTQRTGMAHALPASSNVTAVESALTLGLLAAPKGKKLLCFSGGLGFTLLSAASSHDPVFDIFRAPFQPIYPNTVFIDPASPGAVVELERELMSGDVGLVWFETIQVDANASRPLPKPLIEVINRCRQTGGYLVGVDETQTNLVTGQWLHSQGVVNSPDIVALGSALCDSLVPMGAVLCPSHTYEQARHASATRLLQLQQRSQSPLASHIAWHSLQVIDRDQLCQQAIDKGQYFKRALMQLKQQFPLIREIRGEGLLLTMELELSGLPAFVERSFGYLLWGSMLRDPKGGVAIAVCPIHNHCLRFLPPLTISHNDIDKIIANLRRRLQQGVHGVLNECVEHNHQIGDQRTAGFLADLITKTQGSSSMNTANHVNTGQSGSGSAETHATAQSQTTVGRAQAHNPNSGQPSACIVGAGVGGLASARAFKNKGIPFDCYDKRDRIGGIWAFDETGEHTSVWHSMNMNTPRGLYQFSDFPMPEHYPDFPSHRQVHAYLDSFVDHFCLRESIHLNCGIRDTERLSDGTWKVTLDSGVVRYYDVLIVANGHHNVPNYPDYAERDPFDGDAIHSRYYRYRHDYRDKKVMVVGVGNSGAQIAVDASHDASMTYLSLRRGVYILPHYMFGLRMDKVLGHLNDWWVKKILPYPLFGLMHTGLYNLLVAKRKQMGMPKPDHLMMSSLPTLSENFANRVGDGKLKVIPEVKRIEGKTVHLADGSSVEVDSIIYSTGYQTSFPFLDDKILQVEDNRIPLFQRIFLPDVPNIAFVGLFQAVTWGFLDMMERQANLVADYLVGDYHLPDADEQQASIMAEAKVIKREFLSTLRNNYEMHGPTYMHGLKLELKRGMVRANAAGRARPVEPQAYRQGQSEQTPAAIQPRFAGTEAVL